MTAQTQSKLGAALLQNLIQMREQKGTLSMEDMGAIFERVADTMELGGGASDRFVQKEIEKMAKYLSEAKEHLIHIAPDDAAKNKHLGEASDHLDVVIKATEDASNSIMDAADEIQNLAGQAGGEVGQKITDACTKIYEACNFQDLTGQRLKKVITTLEYLDEKISKLAELFNTTPERRAAVLAAAPAANQNKPQREDAHLLNGPQNPDKAPSQDDIDALFASIKP